MPRLKPKRGGPASIAADQSRLTTPPIRAATLIFLLMLFPPSPTLPAKKQHLLPVVKAEHVNELSHADERMDQSPLLELAGHHDVMSEKHMKAFLQQRLSREVYQAPPQAVLSVLEQATVQIAAFDGSTPRTDPPGSGVFISHRELLTNSHVLGQVIPPGTVCGQAHGEPAQQLFVLATQDRGKPPVPKFTAVLAQNDPQHDLALLRLDKQLQLADVNGDTQVDLNDLKVILTSGQPLQLSALPEQPIPAFLKFGDSEEAISRPALPSVKVAGYPCTTDERNRLDCKKDQPLLQIDVKTGNVSGLEGADRQTQLLKIEHVAASFGNSGGAVVDETTQSLIGLLCGGELTPLGGFALARPIHQAEELTAAASVKIPPAACFRPEPAAPKVQEIVTFDASNSKPRNPGGRIVEYAWDFNGDGRTDATGEKVAQAFASSGLRPVILTVTEEAAGERLSSSMKRTVPISCKEGQPGKIQIETLEFPTIQAAIDAVGQTVSEGATITVGPGTYCESVTIRRKILTLQGAGRDLVFIFGNGRDPVIAISDVTEAPGVTVSGVAISGGLVGIEAVRSSVVIAGNALRQNLSVGIRLTRSSGEIRGSVIEKTEPDQGSLGRGIDLDGSQKVYLIDNVISENAEAGLVLGFNSEAAIERSTVSNNRNQGAVITGKSQVTFGADIFMGNIKIGLLVTGNSAVTQRSIQVFTTTADVAGNFGTGIVVEENSRLELAEGIIAGNEGIGLLVMDASAELRNAQVRDNRWVGLSVRGLATLSLIDSKVHENINGVVVGESAKATLVNSDAFDSVLGLWVGGSARVTLSSSNVSDSRDGVLVIDSAVVSLTNYSSVSDNENAGIRLYDSATCSLASSIVSGNMQDGLVILDSAMAQLVNSIVRNNDESEIWMAGSAQLAIQNSAVTGNAAVSLYLEGKAKVEITDSRIDSKADAEGTFGDGILAVGNAQLRISNSTITGARRGIALMDSTVSSIRGTIISNSSFGITMFGAAQLEASETRIVNNMNYGFAAVESATMSLVDSQISHNSEGLAMWDSVSVNVIRSQISDNLDDGLEVKDFSKVELRDSAIEGNGVFCQQAGPQSWDICNGIEVSGHSQLVIIDSTIRNNGDWGVGAWTVKCGYDKDEFAGTVEFKGNNFIDTNSTSGDQNGMGNPGDHPWNRTGVPDGQVCLP